MRGTKSRIIVDVRESHRVKKGFSDLGCDIEERSLSPADYVVSDECTVDACMDAFLTMNLIGTL